MLCGEQVFPPEVPKVSSRAGISLLTLVRSRWPYCSWQDPVQFYCLESIPVPHQALNFSNFQCDSQFRRDTESDALVYTYTYVNLGLTAHRFYVCLIVLVAFQFVAYKVWSPKFYKSSITRYILLCWNKMPKVQGNYRLYICIYMQIWLCFVLQI